MFDKKKNNLYNETVFFEGVSLCGFIRWRGSWVRSRVRCLKGCAHGGPIVKGSLRLNGRVIPPPVGDGRRL